MSGIRRAWGTALEELHDAAARHKGIARHQSVGGDALHGDFGHQFPGRSPHGPRASGKGWVAPGRVSDNDVWQILHHESFACSGSRGRERWAGSVAASGRAERPRRQDDARSPQREGQPRSAALQAQSQSHLEGVYYRDADSPLHVAQTTEFDAHDVDADDLKLSAGSTHTASYLTRFNLNKAAALHSACNALELARQAGLTSADAAHTSIVDTPAGRGPHQEPVSPLVALRGALSKSSRRPPPGPTPSPTSASIASAPVVDDAERVPVRQASAMEGAAKQVASRRRDSGTPASSVRYSTIALQEQWSSFVEDRQAFPAPRHGGGRASLASTPATVPCPDDFSQFLDGLQGEGPVSDDEASGAAEAAVVDKDAVGPPLIFDVLHAARSQTSGAPSRPTGGAEPEAVTLTVSQLLAHGGGVQFVNLMGTESPTERASAASAGASPKQGSGTLDAVSSTYEAVSAGRSRRQPAAVFESDETGADCGADKVRIDSAASTAHGETATKVQAERVEHREQGKADGHSELDTRAGPGEQQSSAEAVEAAEAVERMEAAEAQASGDTSSHAPGERMSDAGAAAPDQLESVMFSPQEKAAPEQAEAPAEAALGEHAGQPSSPAFLPACVSEIPVGVETSNTGVVRDNVLSSEGENVDTLLQGAACGDTQDDDDGGARVRSAGQGTPEAVDGAIAVIADAGSHDRDSALAAEISRALQSVHSLASSGAVRVVRVVVTRDQATQSSPPASPTGAPPPSTQPFPEAAAVPLHRSPKHTPRQTTFRVYSFPRSEAQAGPVSPSLTSVEAIVVPGVHAEQPDLPDQPEATTAAPAAIVSHAPIAVPVITPAEDAASEPNSETESSPPAASTSSGDGAHERDALIGSAEDAMCQAQAALTKSQQTQLRRPLRNLGAAAVGRRPGELSRRAAAIAALLRRRSSSVSAPPGHRRRGKGGEHDIGGEDGGLDAVPQREWPREEPSCGPMRTPGFRMHEEEGEEADGAHAPAMAPIEVSISLISDGEGEQEEEEEEAGRAQVLHRSNAAEAKQSGPPQRPSGARRVAGARKGKAKAKSGKLVVRKRRGRGDIALATRDGSDEHRGQEQHQLDAIAGPRSEGVLPDYARHVVGWAERRAPRRDAGGRKEKRSGAAPPRGPQRRVGGQSPRGHEASGQPVDATSGPLVPDAGAADDDLPRGASFRSHAERWHQSLRGADAHPTGQRTPTTTTGRTTAAQYAGRSQSASLEPRGKHVAGRLEPEPRAGRAATAAGARTSYRVAPQRHAAAQGPVHPTRLRQRGSSTSRARRSAGGLVAAEAGRGSRRQTSAPQVRASSATGIARRPQPSTAPGGARSPGFEGSTVESRVARQWETQQRLLHEAEHRRQQLRCPARPRTRG